MLYKKHEQKKCNQIKIHKYEHFKGVSSYGRTACYKNKLQANCKWDSGYSNGKTQGSKVTTYCWLWFSDFCERILKKELEHLIEEVKPPCYENARCQIWI